MEASIDATVSDEHAEDSDSNGGCTLAQNRWEHWTAPHRQLRSVRHQSYGRTLAFDKVSRVKHNFANPSMAPEKTSSSREDMEPQTNTNRERVRKHGKRGIESKTSLLSLY
ncbi:hypothetical protein NL676_022979 [Syzygium grande]|nr:hypothetical protein NL676_022979 [Syzygium grande]